MPFTILDFFSCYFAYFVGLQNRSTANKNFRKSEVAPNLIYSIFLKLCQRLQLILLIKIR